jgi:hypothetical protein
MTASRTYRAAPPAPLVVGPCRWLRSPMRHVHWEQVRTDERAGRETTDTGTELRDMKVGPAGLLEKLKRLGWPGCRGPYVGGAFDAGCVKSPLPTKLLVFQGHMMFSVSFLSR